MKIANNKGDDLIIINKSNRTVEMSGRQRRGVITNIDIKSNTYGGQYDTLKLELTCPYERFDMDDLDIDRLTNELPNVVIKREFVPLLYLTLSLLVNVALLAYVVWW